MFGRPTTYVATVHVRAVVVVFPPGIKPVTESVRGGRREPGRFQERNGLDWESEH